MAVQIVTVNVTQQSAPAPVTLQQRGAAISQGGTSLGTGSLTLMTSLADVTAVLVEPKATTSLTWSTNVTTLTTTAPHGWPNGTSFLITVSGVTPTAYNGTFVATITGASTMTYPLTTNPGGSATIQGTVAPYSRGEILRMFTTYFAQPGAKPAYILELGPDAENDGVADLSSWITANAGTDNQIYAWLAPFAWGDNSDFGDLVALYNAPDKLMYFYITTTVSAGYAEFTGSKAAAVMAVPAIPTGSEFAMAAVFATALKQSPSSANRVPPLEYAPLFGVTAYPTVGNQALFTTLAADNVSWVSTGAEGGLTNTILKGGNYMDAKPWNYWYAADWANLNIRRALANEIINGSASNVNPLYYNQEGIDRLQNRAFEQVQNSVTYGLGLGTPAIYELTTAEFYTNFNAGLYVGELPVNAEPFLDYTAANPSAYSIGQYGGLTVAFTPLRGFDSIIFNLSITDVVSA